MQHYGARLLGVPGLTRSALDNCIDTFFSTVGQVFSLSEPQATFRRRVRVHLYYTSGLDIPAELADIAHDPASRLLILAVACRGAFFSPHSDLAEDLYAHCRDILWEETDSVTTDYLDTIDAILLLSELTIKPRNKTAIQLDPLGKGTVVDLAFYHGIHIAPPFESPNFQRRLGLFTRVWIHDAIRSASAHTVFRITEDDMGWPMPSIVDGIPYVALTRAIRGICSDLLSPRAKCLGISDEAVLGSISTLSDLRQRLKVNVETLNACLVPGASPENEPLYPFNADDPLSPMEQLFMMSTNNWLFLVVWVAVQEVNERSPGQLSPETTAAAEAATMEACDAMATLTQISILHSLHVRGPRSIRNHMAAFALFLVRVFSSIQNPSVEQSNRYFTLAETLNFGVRSATYYPDSETLANTLRMALYRAKRISVKDAARVAERGLEGLPTDDADAADAADKPDAIPGILKSDYTDPAWQQQQPQPQFQPQPQPQPQPTQSLDVNNPLLFAPPTDESVSPAVSLDWGELMHTLEDCGFELPLGLLAFQ